MELAHIFFFYSRCHNSFEFGQNNHPKDVIRRTGEKAKWSWDILKI